MAKSSKKTPLRKPKASRSTAVPDVTRVLQGGMPLALGVRITSITRQKVIGEMPVAKIHMNLNGRVNGGAIMSFGDVLGAAGAVANRPPGYRGGTIESKTNFFAGGKGPLLTGVSVALHVGRTTSVWQTTIKNADGRMVAIVTQTQISVPVAGEREVTKNSDE